MLPERYYLETLRAQRTGPPWSQALRPPGRRAGGHRRCARGAGCAARCAGASARRCARARSAACTPGARTLAPRDLPDITLSSSKPFNTPALGLRLDIYTRDLLPYRTNYPRLSFIIHFVNVHGTYRTETASRGSVSVDLQMIYE